MRAQIRRCIVITLAVVAVLSALASSAPARTAYVANSGSGNLSVIDTEANTAGAPVAVGGSPTAIAITPDGARAYVGSTGGVTVVELPSKTVTGTIPLSGSPSGIAITPDGTRAYARSTPVEVIDTQTNTVVGGPIAVGNTPIGIAISPAGTRAYVANFGTDNVSVIDTATNTVVGAIPIGDGPFGIAITPDGGRAYVANSSVGGDSISVIDTATNTVIGAPIPVGDGPRGVAITPDGTRAYVANGGADNVSVIDTATNTVIGAPIPAGDFPLEIAITPDGTRAYVTNFNSDNVTVIDTQTNLALGAIQVGSDPRGIAIVPNQPPQAKLRVPARRLRATLKGGGSSDPDGQITAFDFGFGDRKATTKDKPTTRHRYKPGRFTATLTLTDNEGCSTAFVFTGQTASCNGSAVADASRVVAALKLGRLKRNEEKGTASLAVKVPSRGTLKLSGKGVANQRPAAGISKAVKGKGVVRLQIKAKGRAKRKLDRTGAAKVKIKVTFKPKGGDRNRQTQRVKLVKGLAGRG